MDTARGVESSQRPGVAEAFSVGLVAALVLAALMLLLRLSAGVPTLPELASDALISLVPGPLFSLLLDALGHNAKPLLFLSLLLCQVALGGAAGVFYARWWLQPGGDLYGASRVWRCGISGSLVYSALLWLVTMALLLPLLGAGAFGREARGGGSLLAPVYLALALTYGAALFLLLELRRPAQNAEQTLARVGAPGDPVLSDSQRRDFLGNAALAVVGLAASSAVGGLLFQLGRLSTITQATTHSRGGLSPEVTPNPDFYVVSKNFVDPVVDLGAWALEVGGLVDRPYTLRYEELMGMASVTQYTTLECISNPVGGDLMSNALWKGVPLRALLERAGVKAGATEVVLRCADEYSDSLSLAKALEPTTLLVYEMNGEPLSHKHGFPARLIVPGIYGMKNVKWLTSITLADHDYKGYWERQGWSDEAVVRTTSRIDFPPREALLVGSRYLVGGVAFSGDRGIRRVEVSFDNGQTWLDAQLKDPLSPFTWVLWTTTWMPPKLGSYQIKARATDGAGTPQIVTPGDPFPDGATGLHRTEVLVL